MPDSPAEMSIQFQTKQVLRCLRHALSIAIAVALSGCGYERFLADREIDRLCEIDGGVRVIEYDDPPKEFLRLKGTIDLQELSNAKAHQSYHIVRRSTTLQRDPEIARIEAFLIRGSDQKLLGTAVAYLRPRDHSYMLSPFPKFKMCPENGAGAPLVKAVFRTELAFN